FAVVDKAGGEGLRVEAGGRVVEAKEFGGPGPAELVGLGAAAIILFIAFGSLVAMGLPIVTALFGLGAAFGITALLTHVLAIPEFTPAFVAMIGIGVGIDYALLVVTRFREGIHRGDAVEDAVGTAVNTAGRSV